MKKPLRVTPSSLAEVRRVLALEARTLDALARSAGPAYLKALRLLAACRGKVVVTGMGKSGIIAQKISATLASTGTPAIYMHPAEGMHGDLGVIERDDLVFAIGKSGESPEINTILPSLKRLGVRILALTAAPSSTLTRYANAVLVTPIEREACPLNLAPTCSTTAALAVGDALAVALMGMRDFRKEHFAALHPGGQLGRRLTLRVADVMRSGRDNPVVSVGAAASRLLVEMTRKHAGAASIVDRGGRLVGFVTDHDIRKAISRKRDVFKLPIRSIMNPKPHWVRADRLLTEAAALMTERAKPFNTMPVVDARGRAAGLLHIQDIRASGI